jgi:hypothetical protein
MSSEIVKEGTLLAAAVGREDFEMLNKQADLNVQKHYEKAERELEATVNAAAEEIRQDVTEELTSPLFKAFVASLEKSQAVSAKNVGNGMDVERIKAQVNWIKGIGEKAGVQLNTSAARGFVSTAGDGFLRSIDVVGSGMHRSVLTVGKFVGFKFKPWQAVGIAKNLGNAAKFLGPALGIATVGVELLQIQQEQQREQQMADVRREITSQFQVIAKDLENQIQIQLWEFEAQTYGEIEQKILEARQQEESAIAASNKWVKQLAEIRQDFELILRYITKATENSVV